MSDDSYPAPSIQIMPGCVLPEQEHLVAMIRQRGKWQDLARLAPLDASTPEAGAFKIHWLIDLETRNLRIKQVEDSINFLLVERERRSWSYLCYHTTTSSNLYSGEAGDVCWRLEKTRV